MDPDIVSVKIAAAGVNCPYHILRLRWVIHQKPKDLEALCRADSGRLKGPRPDRFIRILMTVLLPPGCQQLCSIFQCDGDQGVQYARNALLVSS